jgi:putative addiction module component (TIGR02574 family)
MPKTLSQVARDAAELPVRERLQLARMMLDLTEAQNEPPGEIQSAWDDEIQARLEELRSGQVKGVPLDQTKARIEAGFKS